MMRSFKELLEIPSVKKVTELDASKMDLSELTSFPITPELCEQAHQEVQAEQEAFKAKYGDAWYQKWVDHICGLDLGYDERIKGYNEAIYFSGYISISGDYSVIERETRAFDKRLREVYGDQYDLLKRTHEYKDPRVAELLLNEAMVTGKWMELPDELQGTYHERTSGK